MLSEYQRTVLRKSVHLYRADRGRQSGRELYTATFEQLDFQEQSNSIQAQIMGLEQAILANLRRAPLEGYDRDETLGKRVKQIDNLEKRASGEGKAVIADNL